MPDHTEQARPGPDGEPRLRSLWASVNFIKYMSVRWFNSLAIQLITVTVGWQIYEMTSNPLDLGFVGLSQFAPIFFLFLAAGLAADRLNRRAIIASCNIAHVLVAAFLFVYAQTGATAPWPIFVVLLIHGGARAFYHPSLTSILPNIVPRQQFPSAIAYATSVGKLSQLAGPALAGILIALIGLWVYLVALVSFAIAAVCAALLVSPGRERPRRAIGLAELVSGFVYVWNTRLVLAVMSMDLVAILFSGILGMLPVFARDILAVGPQGLGILRAMPAVGAVTVGLFLAQLPLRENVGRTLVISVVVIGLASTAFALSELFWLSLLLLVVFGAADMVSTNIRQTLVQLATPDGMRGRVASVHGVTTNASNEIGDFRAGVTAAVIGIVPAVAVGGLVTVSLSLLWWRIFPDLRRASMHGTR
jgi:MFS family permease